ncbi:histidine phosphatase family protein [Gemella cuniculi]|uniref:histidine phosphatase family protein n=1 Tax=Gemella cuniculi TaxID=150240 RepID=UPI00041BA5AC|nr:histidine phosphatase family protein [Gemella cuniculi]
MKIYLVRHGETDYNKNFLVQGHTNIPLNETGIKQAKEAAKKLQGVKLDAAFSSTMDRAYDTCRYMLDGSNNSELLIEKDERVIEKHYGKFEGATYEEWHAGRDAEDLIPLKKMRISQKELRIF